MIILTTYSDLLHVSILICSKVTMHNVIPGKSSGSHLEIMQIRPIMKEVSGPPPLKNITNLIMRSPCARTKTLLHKYSFL